MQSPQPEILTDADILKAFAEFPSPLVILDTESDAAWANLEFLKRFTLASIGKEQRNELIKVNKDDWRNIQLRTRENGVTDLRAMTKRAGDYVLVNFGDDNISAITAELHRLKVRIADLEHMAATDHLTGAWNRAHFDRTIDAERARSQALNLPISICLIDIDHFKKINDGFGHSVGDEVLCELVKRIRARTRASDLVFRWGGEEFAILVPSAGYRRASIIAEDLRRLVAEHPFGKVGNLTISVGVAEHFDNESSGEWFRRLDSALYAAKDNGRNRVVVDRRGNSDVWAKEAATSPIHLTWQEGYECGNSTIDNEHRELFKLANSLIDTAIQHETKPEDFREALSILIDHVVNHFADEEEILKKHNYSALAQHKLAHAGLIRRALELKEKVSNGKVGLGEIVEFLAQDVVARHMMVVDRAFYPLFINKEP